MDVHTQDTHWITENTVKYKTIFAINIIIYICLQHSNVL